MATMMMESPSSCCLRPRPPAHQPRRQSPRRRSAALSATDEFWLVPSLAPASPPAAAPTPAAAAAPSAAVLVDDDDRRSPSSAMDVVEDDDDEDESLRDEGDGDGDGDTDDGGRSLEVEVLSLPPAHRQLLSSLPATVEDLKGRDHTAGIGCDDDVDMDEEEFGSSGPPSFAVKKKKKARGSWLLGFVRLNDQHDESVAPEREESVLSGAGSGGLVDGVPGGLSLDADECDSSSSSSSSDEDSLGLPSVASAAEEGKASQHPPSRKKKAGVSFDPAVIVHPIPPSSSLSATQRRRMYSSTQEVRRNKARNKKEFRYDGHDWREATEEWEMGVDMRTGELVHPAHEEGC